MTALQASMYSLSDYSTMRLSPHFLASSTRGHSMSHITTRWSMANFQAMRVSASASGEIYRTSGALQIQFAGSLASMNATKSSI